MTKSLTVVLFKPFKHITSGLCLTFSPINLSHPVLLKPPRILQFSSLEVGSAKDLITGEFGVLIAPPRLVGPIPGEWMTRWIDSWISTVTLNYQLFPKILKRITFSSFELSWSKVSVGKASAQKNILDQLVAAKRRRSKFRSQIHFQVHLRGGR